jgi:poly-gamma-glutamate synthesis protein (capsule biosynthesis protein)
MVGSFIFFFSKLRHEGVEKIVVEKNENRNLSSFYKNKDDYEAAFSHVKDVKRKNIIAGIISHHFLAKDLIANFFAGINNENVKNIVVVGPDHFSRLNDDKISAATTFLPWNTPYGQVFANEKMLNSILNDESISENNTIFLNEHSIYTLVPFIKKTFPNAKIIPLIVHNNYDFEKFINLGKIIKSNVDSETIMIVSSDFSHNLSENDAKTKDMVSIENLKDINTENIQNISCDCRACMAIMLGFVGVEKRGSFDLVENKNSNDFGGQEKTVTSYVSAYYLAPSN